MPTKIPVLDPAASAPRPVNSGPMQRTTGRGRCRFADRAYVHAPNRKANRPMIVHLPDFKESGRSMMMPAIPRAERLRRLSQCAERWCKRNDAHEDAFLKS